MLHTRLSEMTKGRARIVETHPNMLEIVPLGTSKSNGVKILLDHLEINSDEVTCFGSFIVLADFNIQLIPQLGNSTLIEPIVHQFEH